MSWIADQFDPATETSTTFNAGFSNGAGRIVVYNQSPNNLNISWDSFSTYCPAWTAMLYCVTASTVKLNWTIQSTLVNAVAPPISQVTIEAFNAGETIQGTYPASLMHQINVGNNVGTTVTATNSISNTGNGPLSNWLVVMPNDALANTFTADTSGNLTVKGDNAGVLTTLLQLIAGASPAVKLAAAAVLTEVLGTLQVDQAADFDSTLNADGAVTFGSTLGVTGLLTATGGITLPNAAYLNGLDNAATSYKLIGADASNNVNIGTMEAAGTGRVRIVDSHGNIIASFIDANTVDGSVDGGSASMSTGKVYFSIGGIKAVNTGTGLSGTINHGLSGTPAAILCVCDTASSSATVGAYSYTTTQFGMTIGGALDGRWWGYR